MDAMMLDGVVALHPVSAGMTRARQGVRWVDVYAQERREQERGTIGFQYEEHNGGALIRRQM